MHYQNSIIDPTLVAALFSNYFSSRFFSILSNYTIPYPKASPFSFIFRFIIFPISFSTRLYFSFTINALTIVQVISLQQWGNIKTNANIHDELEFKPGKAKSINEICVVEMALKSKRFSNKKWGFKVFLPETILLSFYLMMKPFFVW